MVKDIVIRATLEGEGEVSAGFRRMGESSRSLSTELRTYGRELASIGASAVGIARVGEQFGLLSKQQAEVMREMGGLVALGGTVARTLGILAKESRALELVEKARGVATAFANTMASGISSIAGGIKSAFSAIASSSFGVALADKTRAVASAVAHAFSGPWGWAILAGAAAAAASAIAAISGMVKLQQGGIVYKPTVALIGEREPEVVTPLSKLKPSVNVGPIYIQNPVFRSRSDIDYLVDRLKRMGKI